MKWKRVLNSFIFIPNNEELNSCNFKISSNICSFHESPSFSLDDITNISFNAYSSIISTSTTCSDNNLNNIKLLKYIHNIKTSIGLRVEYKSSSGIKIFNFSSAFGDFVTSSCSSTSVDIYPQLMCLWVSSNNVYNLTLTYLLATPDQ